MVENQPKILLLTADDAFMHPHIDYAILHFLAQDFCPITNVSFMVNGENAAKAAEAYRDLKRSDAAFGLHLTLINRKRDFPSLLLQNYQSIRDRIEQQIEEFYTLLGDYPLHIDSHLGAQFSPNVLPQVIEIAGSLGISIRTLSGIPMDLSLTGTNSYLSAEKVTSVLGQGRSNKPMESVFHPAFAQGERRIPRFAYRYAEFEALADPRLQIYFEENPHVRRMSWGDFQSSRK